METEKPGQPATEKPERTAEDVRWVRVERKRERIRSEIERNRAGGHKVPTWVLGAVLGLVVLAWVVLIIVS